MNAGLTIPGEVLDTVAEIVAARVLDRLADATPGADAGASPWVDAEGAATHLHTTKRRVYSLAQQGRIPHYREGARLLFDRRELDQWLRSGDAADTSHGEHRD